MARRRMFSLDIIDTDLFMDMPQSSRLLYYELCMRADDDGFVASPKKIMKMVGCGEDDFKVLIAKQFIIPFETGIVVIKHWKIHNYIQSDRYKTTIYQDEKQQLNQDKTGMYTKCIQDGYTGKDRLGKDRLGNNIYAKKYFENEEVNNLFLEFLEMRKKIKAVNSDRAINTLINKLNKYSDEIRIKMIEKSIVSSWKDIYEIKTEKNNPDWLNKEIGEEQASYEEIKKLEERMKR